MASSAAPTTETQPENCQIVRLPPEILLSIIDFLKPCDLFFLSQTCKALRQLTTRDWKNWRHRALFIQKFAFDFGLAYPQAARWFCPGCLEFHPVNYQDGPQSPVERCFSQSRELHSAFDVNVDILRNHVQLAVKYTRLLPNLTAQQKTYLATLMTPLSQENIDCGYGVRLMYETEPRVVDGIFLLREEYLFYRADEDDDDQINPLTEASFVLDSGFACALCPHLIIEHEHSGTQESRAYKQMMIDWMDDDEFGNWELEDAIDDALHDAVQDTIENALMGPSDEMSFAATRSCPRCATDFTAHVYMDDMAKVWALSLHVWSVLGGDRVEHDDHWAMHARFAGHDVDLVEIPRSGTFKGTYRRDGGVKRHWEKTGGTHRVRELPATDDDGIDNNGDPLPRPHPRLWAKVEAPAELDAEQE